MKQLQWWDSLSYTIKHELRIKYGFENCLLDNTVINIMYERELSVPQQWFIHLHPEHKKRLWNEYALDGTSIGSNYKVIEHMYKCEARYKANDNPTCLQYCQGLNKVSLNERYDLVATSLMTLPLSVDELSTICQILVKNKERNKQ